MKILAIIPARGGSKGVPHKNIIDVCGKPLIQYTIEVALEGLKKGVIERCVVSTDDSEIAKISNEIGAEVPFLRPQHLASDSAKSIDAVLHAVNYFAEKGHHYDAVLLLQPTCPIRSLTDLENVVNIYNKSKQESLISAYKEEYICDLVSYYKKDDCGIPLNKNHNEGIRRQEQEKLYIRNGTFYLTNTAYLLSERKIISATPALYVMSKRDSINIDTHEDLELLKWRLSK